VAVGARLDDPQRPTGGGGSVQPAWPVLTGAPCYTAMVLRFQCFLFLRNQWSARNSPRGSSTGGGGSRAGHAVARFKPQPPAMVGEHSKGRLTTRLGQMGAAQNIEHRL
jgi:hypothetical protein